MRIHLLTICVFHHNRLFDHLGSMCKVQKLIWWADVCCVFWVNNSWKIHQSSIIQFISRHSFPASSFSHTTYQSRLDCSELNSTRFVMLEKNINFYHCLSTPRHTMPTFTLLSISHSVTITKEDEALWKGFGST